MYTSMGSGAPGRESRTRMTEAAGLGSTGARGSAVTVSTIPASIAPPGAGRARRAKDLEIYQLSDLLAMVGGITKRELRRLGALEVQVQVVLPGEADATVQLDAGAGNLAVGVRGVGLGHGGGERGLGHVLVHRPCRVVRERLGVLHVDE